MFKTLMSYLKIYTKSKADDVNTIFFTWTHVLSELKNWNIEGAIWNKVQILQDAPTEPSPHTSLLYIPPLWRASRKTSQFQIKTILLANTFHRHWYAQGFAPDQYGPSVLHKRPFCNAFSGCGSGKRFFHSESTGCRKKNSKEKSKWAAGAPSNISNNFRASGGDSKEVGEGFYSENPIWNYLKASIAPFDFYETFWDTLYNTLFTIIIIPSTYHLRRVEICQDRHNRRSWKICASCVIFPKKTHFLAYFL